MSKNEGLHSVFRELIQGLICQHSRSQQKSNTVEQHAPEACGAAGVNNTASKGAESQSPRQAACLTSSHESAVTVT